MSVIEVAAKVSIALEPQLHKICHCLDVSGSVVGVKLEAVIFSILNISYEMFKEVYVSSSGIIPLSGENV